VTWDQAVVWLIVPGIVAIVRGGIRGSASTSAVEANAPMKIAERTRHTRRADLFRDHSSANFM
jgi:hypothetical protein